MLFSLERIYKNHFVFLILIMALENIACSPIVAGQTSLPVAETDTGAGTMKVSLTKIVGQVFRFSYTPLCKHESDYLICNGYAFQNGSMFLLTHQKSTTCGNFGTVDIDFMCQELCAGNENCLGVTIVCIDVTKGVALTVDAMPPNQSC